LTTANNCMRTITTSLSFIQAFRLAHSPCLKDSSKKLVIFLIFLKNLILLHKAEFIGVLISL
jgi:hypothetical protein